MLKNILRSLLLVSIGLGLSHISLSQATENLKIALVGDSTVCLYAENNPTRGWGQILPEFFTANVSYMNLAQGGTSTKTFPADKWQKILADKPHFIFIQFGHNDSHAKGQPESTDAATDYKENLRRYIKEARDAGSMPIFVTPPHRRIFDSNQKITMELAPYANAMKEIAAELKVPLIDLFTKSGDLFEKLGEEGTKDFTVNTPNPTNPKNIDRTHFTKQGATVLAKIVAEDAAEIDPRLKEALKK